MASSSCARPARASSARISRRRLLKRRRRRLLSASARDGAAPAESPTARCRRASTGRGTADSSSVAELDRAAIGSASASAPVSYSERRRGSCAATRARSSICSGAVRNSTSAQASVGWSLQALTASCAPPSAAAGCPPSAAGNGADGKPVGDTRLRLRSCSSAHAYGQLRMKAASPF